MLALDCGVPFEPSNDDAFFAALPERPAVFLVEPRESSAHPFLSRTANLRKRLERLLGPPDAATKRLNLREIAARVRYRVTGSPFEQALTFYQHARENFPRRYRDMARIRPPALLKVNRRAEYPRCYVTRRIFADSGFYLGPFPSRKAAESFANEFLNLFKIRRCQIKIRRDPAFPGCIYSEMKMCLAPCFAGCTKPEYDSEVARVVDFLTTNGESLENELEQERGVASLAEDFETAAVFHKRLDKLYSLMQGLPKLPRQIEQLTAAILQPAAEAGTVAIYALQSGIFLEPFVLRFGQIASEPRSVEQILRDHLSAAPKADTPSEGVGNQTALRELEDHLALVGRWFYSKPRVGEIFFFGKDWPYRKMIRACSRILAGQQPEKNPSGTTEKH
ncbi:MAG: hypothetical protein HY046_14390 [Acidobacteria bacterium]|nr:hypothetical protein [Acidobacteriota bacterium]